MNPDTFRGYSVGPKSILFIANNEFRAFLRNKGLLISMIMSPLITYGLLVLTLDQSIGEIHYQGIALTYSQYALPGVMSFFLTTQMSQAMYRSTIDKTYGLLAYKFLNGVQPRHYIIGMSALPCMGFIVQSAVLIALGSMSGGIINVFTVIASLLIFLISLLFWTTVGILLSTRIKSYEQRDVLMTIIFSPLAYASPALYVINEQSPIIIRLLAAINPLTYQLEAARTIAYGVMDWHPIVVAVILACIALVFGQICLNNMELTLEDH